ncbi:MAG: PEP-utilizing enzyme [Patescibacteria group bacterium]
MDVKAFANSEWNKIWAGSWCLLSCSHFADQYTKEMRFGTRPFLRQCVIFVRDAKSEGWTLQSERDAFGAVLSGEVVANPHRVAEIVDSLKKHADLMLSFISKHEHQEVTEDIYRDFWDLLLAYYSVHINVKYVVDYLPSVELEKYMHAFEGARTYAEPVLNRTEDFMKAFAEQAGEVSGYSPVLILCLTKEEVYVYFTSGTLPSKEILEKRNQKACIVADEKSSELFAGEVVLEIEEILIPKNIDNVVKGQIAYGGKARGRVRVILDPEKPGDFKEGDILVAGMTRPEYLSLMKKAGAFVTDSGGILSHASIVARELKKPCIIGTKIATKVLKDGDMVEVDAEKGVVTILK